MQLTKYELHPGRLSDYSREKFGIPKAGVGASFSVYWSKAVLDGIFGDPTTPTITAPVFLALTSVTPDDTMTGTTITDIAYTTYARKSIAAADMSAASGSTTATKTNTAAETFAACTALTATAIGWAITDAVTVGNMLCWGTCTSTVISTTQTPPTVAIGALVVNLD